jgi:hypothetical protein
MAATAPAGEGAPPRYGTTVLASALPLRRELWCPVDALIPSRLPVAEPAAHQKTRRAVPAQLTQVHAVPDSLRASSGLTFSHTNRTPCPVPAATVKPPTDGVQARRSARSAIVCGAGRRRSATASQGPAVVRISSRALSE